MTDALLTVSQVATHLGVPVATVYAWNSRGLGPRRYRVGKYVRYRRADVEAWIELHAAPTPFEA